jgi:6-phosphogluconolactonase
MPRFLTACLLFFAAVALSAQGSAKAQPPSGGEMLVYFGTYTNATKSKGIYLSRLDTATGMLSPAKLSVETVNPSFLTVDPTGRFLYSVNEINTYRGQETGAVSAFAIDRKSGLLKPLNEQPSEGSSPAHLTIDRDGKNVLVANYGGGSVAVLPVARDGTLKSGSSFVQHKGSSVNKQRQAAPHAHSITTDPSGRFVYVADLGLDWIVIYQFDERKGILNLNNPPNVKVAPGAGPRHFSVHPSGRFGYVINEMNLTVTAFTVDKSNGGLTELQTISALPPKQAPAQGMSGAELAVHPSGRFLYTSVRGDNTIALYTIDQYTGKLTYVENTPTHGNTPRGFAIDPDGKFLLVGNQNSNNVVVFRIDPQIGQLTLTGGEIDVPAPVSVAFVK